MMYFSTSASVSEVRGVAPEAMDVQHDRGMTTFVVRDTDAKCVLSEMKRACHSVQAGHPRVSYSSPRAFASASSHLRVR
jgi:hypothetical protein